MERGGLTNKLTDRKYCMSGVLTDLEVKYVVGAHCLAPVLVELLNVDWDGESLQLGGLLQVGIGALAL